jgi:hypothetical protein
MDIDAIKAFIKMHSVIPNKFIDDFLDMNPRTALQTDPVIDLDIVGSF